MSKIVKLKERRAIMVSLPDPKDIISGLSIPDYTVTDKRYLFSRKEIASIPEFFKKAKEISSIETGTALYISKVVPHSINPISNKFKSKVKNEGKILKLKRTINDVNTLCLKDEVLTSFKKEFSDLENITDDLKIEEPEGNKLFYVKKVYLLDINRRENFIGSDFDNIIAGDYNNTTYEKFVKRRLVEIFRQNNGRRNKYRTPSPDEITNVEIDIFNDKYPNKYIEVPSDAISNGKIKNEYLKSISNIDINGFSHKLVGAYALELYTDDTANTLHEIVTAQKNCSALDEINIINQDVINDFMTPDKYCDKYNADYLISLISEGKYDYALSIISGYNFKDNPYWLAYILDKVPSSNLDVLVSRSALANWYYIQKPIQLAANVCFYDFSHILNLLTSYYSIIKSTNIDDLKELLRLISSTLSGRLAEKIRNNTGGKGDHDYDNDFWKDIKILQKTYDVTFDLTPKNVILDKTVLPGDLKNNKTFNFKNA